jgi:hypothetical protein
MASATFVSEIVAETCLGVEGLAAVDEEGGEAVAEPVQRRASDAAWSRMGRNRWSKTLTGQT